MFLWFQTKKLMQWWFNVYDCKKHTNHQITVVLNALKKEIKRVQNYFTVRKKM